MSGVLDSEKRRNANSLQSASIITPILASEAGSDCANMLAAINHVVPAIIQKMSVVKSDIELSMLFGIICALHYGLNRRAE